MGLLWEHLILPALSDKVEGRAQKCLEYTTASEMNHKQWALSEKKYFIAQKLE